MKPEEFATALLGWARTDPQVRAVPFAEAGYPCPWGVQVRLPTGAVVYLQVVGVFPAVEPGPQAGPVLPVAAPVVLPTGGPTPLADVELWLRWRITQAACPQVAAISLFHLRGQQRSVPHGAAITCHNGDRLWVYLRHATPAGRPPLQGPAWRVQPQV